MADTKTKNVMLAMAKDLLKYGYGFKLFMGYPICKEVGEQESRKIWNEAIDIMANDF